MYDLILYANKDRTSHIEGVGFVVEGENLVTTITVDYPDELEIWDKRLFFNTETPLTLIDNQGEEHLSKTFSVEYIEPYTLPEALVEAKIKSIQFVMYHEGMVCPFAVVDFIPYMNSVGGQEGIPLNYYGVSSVAGKTGVVTIVMEDISDLELTDSIDTSLVGLLKGAEGHLEVAIAGVDYEEAGTAAGLIESHEEGEDPHSQYLTEAEASEVYAAKGDVTEEIAGAIGAHVELQNPHNQYIMSVPDATLVSKGVVMVGAGLSVSQGTISSESEGGYLYIGDRAVDGSWRITINGNNLEIQRKVNGDWISKEVING